jgi:hypothetical protein
MKTREKFLLATIWILLIAWIICAWLFIHEQNKIKENSTYCMDRVRHQLWEYLENVHLNDAFGSEWVYIYMWGCTYEWIDYKFTCEVYNKENVELDLEPLYKDEVTEPNKELPQEPDSNIIDWYNEDQEVTWTNVINKLHFWAPDKADWVYEYDWN